MNSIDLVPREYRDAITRRRYVRSAVALVMVVCLIAVLTTIDLASRTARAKSHTEELQKQSVLVSLLDEQMATLDRQKKLLDEEWLLLNSLRSGFAAEEMFMLVDRALPGEAVWFTNWSFKRAGVVVEEAAQETDTGYFIVVDGDLSVDQFPAWQIETHMNIVGQARDHAALSQFVRGLYDQQQIKSVKLNHTRIREYATQSVVDFELAIVLISEPAA